MKLSVTRDRQSSEPRTLQQSNNNNSGSYQNSGSNNQANNSSNHNSLISVGSIQNSPMNNQSSYGNTNNQSSYGNTNQSSYGNSIKNLLGFKKEEETVNTSNNNSHTPDSRRGSLVVDKIMDDNRLKENKKSKSFLGENKMPRTPKLSDIEHNNNSSVSSIAGERGCCLVLKRKMKVDGDVTYFLKRNDVTSVVQFGIVDSSGMNKIGVINDSVSLELSPPHILGNKQYNSSQGVIVDVLSINRDLCPVHQLPSSMRYITCYNDGYIQLSQNEKILWEKRIDAEVLGVGIVSHQAGVTDKCIEEYIVTVGWEGTTYIINQRGNIIYFQMDEKITTFGAGRYSIDAGRSTSAIAYVTNTDEIILHYDLDHTLNSMKVNNVINMLGSQVKDRDLLKQNPNGGE